MLNNNLKTEINKCAIIITIQLNGENGCSNISMKLCLLVIFNSEPYKFYQKFKKCFKCLRCHLVCSIFGRD